MAAQRREIVPGHARDAVVGIADERTRVYGKEWMLGPERLRQLARHRQHTNRPWTMTTGSPEPVLRCWSVVFPFRGANWSSDRRVFDALKDRHWVCTGEPSAFYVMHEGDRNHADRMKYLRESQAAEPRPSASGAPSG